NLPATQQCIQLGNRGEIERIRSDFRLSHALRLEHESRRHVHWNRDRAELFACFGNVMVSFLQCACRSIYGGLTGRSSGLRSERRNYQQSGDFAASQSSHPSSIRTAREQEQASARTQASVAHRRFSGTLSYGTMRVLRENEAARLLQTPHG
ncbi:MAG TPA: hypothetical protein VJ323_11865, partial [Bryobacteraceae bacterium]|nr:hypothetical protein [Bryobacteraceae bacterium]